MALNFKGHSGIYVVCGDLRSGAASPAPWDRKGPRRLRRLVRSEPWLPVGGSGKGRWRPRTPWITRTDCLGVLFGGFGRKIDGFRFLVCVVVFAHLPGKPIYFPEKNTYDPMVRLCAASNLVGAIRGRLPLFRDHHPPANRRLEHELGTQRIMFCSDGSFAHAYKLGVGQN